MNRIVTLTGYLPQEFIVEVVNANCFASNNHSTLFTVKTDPERGAFKAVGIAALAIPNDTLFAKVKTGYASIRCLPVIIEMIAVPAAGHAFGKVNSQSPAGQVQGMDTIIAQFARAPGPEPMQL